MKVNFWANSLDFGVWEAETLESCKDKFASDSGYLSWADMCERAEEFGGNNVEFNIISE